MSAEATGGCSSTMVEIFGGAVNVQCDQPWPQVKRAVFSYTEVGVFSQVIL